MRAIFAAAVRDRLIVRTPAERIVLPELPRRQIVPLTPEQVHALVDAMPDRYRAVAVVAAGAGLRRGELFGLQVGDVDFLRRTIAVERQVVLLAAEGLPNAEIGRRVGTTRQTVIAWRARYVAGGIDALADLPRSGRPAVIDEPTVIVSTLTRRRRNWR